MSKQQEALAATLGLEYPGELRECRYQPTRTAIPVYSCGDFYYCMSRVNPGPLHGLAWERGPDQFWAVSVGAICWRARAEA